MNDSVDARYVNDFDRNGIGTIAGGRFEEPPEATDAVSGNIQTSIVGREGQPTWLELSLLCVLDV